MKYRFFRDDNPARLYKSPFFAIMDAARNSQENIGVVAGACIGEAHALLVSVSCTSKLFFFFADSSHKKPLTSRLTGFCFCDEICWREVEIFLHACTFHISR